VNRDIAGMRGKGIHLYFRVNLDRVWLIVKEDLSQIKPRIKNVLDDLKNEEG
jgi:uncharacterized protein with HEPN domain